MIVVESGNRMIGFVVSSSRKLERMLLAGGARCYFPATVGTVDGQNLLVCADRKKTGIQVLDLYSGHARYAPLRHTKRLAGPLAVAAFDEGPGIVAEYEDEGVVVWNLATGIQRSVFGQLKECPGEFKALTAGSNQGRDVVITGSERGSVQVWDLETGHRHASISIEASIQSLLLHGQYLVVGSSRGILTFSLNLGGVLPARIPPASEIGQRTIRGKSQR